MADVLDFLKSLGQSKEVKAEAIAALFVAFTGERPRVTKGKDARGEYMSIAPSPRQTEILRQNLEAQLAKAPGDVRVDLSGVLLPIILKKSILPMLLAAGAGFAGGRYIK